MKSDWIQISDSHLAWKMVVVLRNSIESGYFFPSFSIWHRQLNKLNLNLADLRN